MKTLRGFRDLEEYGIISLTGEACGLSMRLLCDLTPEGVSAIEEFLGIRIRTGNNWNSREGQVASIMLPHGIFHELAAFLLVREGYEVVYSVNYRGDGHSSHFVGTSTMEDWEEQRDRIFRVYPSGVRVYTASTAPGTGLRNQHMMSGRVD